MSSYKTLAQGIVFGKLKEFKTPISRVSHHRRATIDEIKSCIQEEFGKAKEVEKVKAQEPEGGWHDSELEKNINWVEKLELKEFFKPIKKK